MVAKQLISPWKVARPENKLLSYRNPCTTTVVLCLYGSLAVWYYGTSLPRF